MQKHRHKAAKESRAYAYTAPVSTSAQNPLAHGGISVRVTCTCAWFQWRNVNGRHREYGPWNPPVAVST